MVDEPKPNAQSHGYATAGWVAAPAAGAVIRRVAPILGMVPETDRIPQIQQTISIPLQPGRPAGAARRGRPPCRAAAHRRPPAAPRTPAGARQYAGTGPPRSRPAAAPVTPAVPQPPCAAPDRAPAAFRLAAFPAPSDEAGLAPR